MRATYTHTHTLCSAAGAVVGAPDDMISPCGAPCTTDEEGAGNDDGGDGDPCCDPWLPPPAAPELEEDPKPGKDGLLEIFLRKKKAKKNGGWRTDWGVGVEASLVKRVGRRGGL